MHGSSGRANSAAVLAFLLAAFTPEPDDVSGWTLVRSKEDGARADAIATVPAPVREGETAIRFTIKPGDCVPGDCAQDRERVELKSREEEREGDERWYAWSFYLPEDFVSVWPARQFIAQFHQEGGRPAMLFSLEPEGLKLDSQFLERRILLVPDNELRGRWHDVAMRVLWSKHEGRLEIEINRMRVISSSLPTMSGVSVYFKIGLYRAHLSRHGKVVTQTLIVDNIRRSLTRPAR